MAMDTWVPVSAYWNAHAQVAEDGREPPGHDDRAQDPYSKSKTASDEDAMKQH